jgi:hypothetical protein
MIEWRNETEMTAFLLDYIPGHSLDQIQSEFRDKFGITLTKAQVNGFKSKYNIHQGTKGGQFQKGQVSWNKGKKMTPEQYAKCSRTMFKKGQQVHNHKEVGSERISVDGYVEIKVAEPNHWRLKHRVIYEQHYGIKLSSNDAIIFVDGNRLNLDIDNLERLSRSELVRLNHDGLRGDEAMNRSAITLAKLKARLGEVKIRRGNDEQHRNTDIHRADTSHRKGLRGSTAGRIRERIPQGDREEEGI